MGRLATFGRFLLLFLWLIVGLYVGAAAWTAGKWLEAAPVGTSNQTDAKSGSYSFRGISFANEEEALAFMRQSDDARFFPWIFAVPSEMISLVTAISFGLLGGLIRVLKKNAINGAPLASLGVISAPVFGALVGVMLCLLSFLLPAIFVNGKNTARPESLAGLSLFGGAFSEMAYSWIEIQVRKLFAIQTEKAEASAVTK
jgi:hypothetical protein